MNSPSAQKVSAKFTQVTSKDLRRRHQPKRGRRLRDNKVQDAYESSKWKKQWPSLLGAGLQRSSQSLEDSSPKAARLGQQTYPHSPQEGHWPR